MPLRPSLEPREIAVGRLRPNPQNPRFIRDDRFEALKRSLEQFPWMLRARPVLARTDGRVIAGNMRYRGVVDLGHPKVWTIVIGDEIEDEKTERLVALLDNNPYGEWDEQAVSEWLYDLRSEGVDLDLTGFPKGDVGRMLDSVSGPETPESFPDVEPHVDYRCPGCGFGWSGHPRPTNREGTAPSE